MKQSRAVKERGNPTGKRRGAAEGCALGGDKGSLSPSHTTSSPQSQCCSAAPPASGSELRDFTPLSCSPLFLALGFTQDNTGVAFVVFPLPGHRSHPSPLLPVTLPASAAHKSLQHLLPSTLPSLSSSRLPFLSLPINLSCTLSCRHPSQGSC